MIHLLIKGIEEGEVGIGDSKELIDVEVNTEENINRQQPAPEIEKVSLGSVRTQIVSVSIFLDAKHLH